MGLNDQLLLLTFLSFILGSIFFDASSALYGEMSVHQWTPIKNVSDPKVVDVGRFAIARHNFQVKTSLVFVEVVKGETKVAAGTEYNLTIAAKYGNGGGLDDLVRNYVAVVIDRPHRNFLELIFFTGPIYKWKLNT